MDLYLNIGSQKLVVNVMRITGSISETLNSKLDLCIMRSLFKDLPAEPSESREAYDLRYKKWQEEKKEALKKKEEAPAAKPKVKKGVAEEHIEPAAVEDESLLSYVRKELGLTKYEDQMTYLEDCVAAIADTFDQSSKFDKKALKNTSLVEINNFVFRVCKYSRISIGLELITLDD